MLREVEAHLMLEFDTMVTILACTSSVRPTFQKLCKWEGRCVCVCVCVGGGGGGVLCVCVCVCVYLSEVSCVSSRADESADMTRSSTKKPVIEEHHQIHEEGRRRRRGGATTVSLDVSMRCPSTEFPYFYTHINTAGTLPLAHFYIVTGN